MLDAYSRLVEEFPINRCHQRVVKDQLQQRLGPVDDWGFQSIGVTNEW